MSIRAENGPETMDTNGTGGVNRIAIQKIKTETVWLPRHYQNKIVESQKVEVLGSVSDPIQSMNLELEGLEAEEEQEGYEINGSFGMSINNTLYEHGQKYSSRRSMPFRAKGEQDEFGSRISSGISFLDTFLKSIQIFGYLEDAVFYELSRQLQTRRVLLGERIRSIEENNDFCVVVEGNVNVYATNNDWVNSLNLLHDEDNSEGYYIGEGEKLYRAGTSNPESPRNEVSDAESVQERACFETKDSKETKQLLRKVGTGSILSSLLQLLQIFVEPALSEKSEFDGYTRKRSFIIGIPTEDTTLAVIPAKAFKRVRDRFPQAAAQMVQVILTKLQRVTFVTMQGYLNIGEEVVDFERKMCKKTVQILDKDYLSPNMSLDSLSTFEEIKDGLTKLCAEEIKVRGMKQKEVQRDGKRAEKPKSRTKNAVWSDLEGNYVKVMREGIPSNYTTHNKTNRLKRSNGVITLSEKRLEALGRAHEEFLIHESYNESNQKSSKELMLIKGSPGFETLSHKPELSSIFQEQEQKKEKDKKHEEEREKTPWPVPTASDFKDFKMICIQKMAKSLGLHVENDHFSVSELEAKKNVSDSRLETSNIPRTTKNGTGHRKPNSMHQDTCIFPKLLGTRSATTTPPLSSSTRRVISDIELEGLFSEFQVIYMPKNCTVVERGQKPAGIYMVFDGTLEILEENNTNNDGKYQEFCTSRPEGMVGSWSSNNEQDIIERSAEEMTRLAYKVQKDLEGLKNYNELYLTLETSHSSDKSEKPKGQNGGTTTNKTVSSEYLDPKRDDADVSGQFNEINNNKTAFGRNPSQARVKKNKKRTSPKAKSHFIYENEMVGYFSAITGMSSNVLVKVAGSRQLRGKAGALLGFLPLSSIEKLTYQHPIILTKLAHRVNESLSPLINHIDYALEWKRVKGGKLIYKAGSGSETVHVVLSGRLRAISDSSKANKPSGSVASFAEYGFGQSVGEADVLAGYKRSFSLHTIRDSELIFIPKSLFVVLMSAYPSLTFHISKLIAARMLNQIQNQRSLGYQHNSSTLNNSRPSLAGVNPVMQFNHPHSSDFGFCNTNLKTVCILPVSDNVPVKEFSNKLYQSLVSCIGPDFALVDCSAVIKNVGRNAFSRLGRLKIQSWLAGLEEKNRMLLYVADEGINSPWTLQCISQADCILIIGIANELSEIGPYERLVLASRSTARKELVLLHPKRKCPSGTTRSWLVKRPWIRTHHHIQLSSLSHVPRNTFDFTLNESDFVSDKKSPLFTRAWRVFVDAILSVLLVFKPEGKKIGKGQNSLLSPGYTSPSVTLNAFKDSNGRARSSLELPFLLPRGIYSSTLSTVTHDAINTITGGFKSYYTKLLQARNPIAPTTYKSEKSDFDRLARRLCNLSVGLVMSGGGARGNALLGVIRAFEEAGIPIDMVGGTSIGSFYSGLYAYEPDTVYIYTKAKQFSFVMKSLWRQLLDVTWPFLSYTTGNEFNRALWKTFKETEVEDLWLPFYCVSTNVTHSCLEFHTSGYLWKNCRASMSLCGFLPPMCDANGSMLVDGGYLDNLPIEYMKYGLGASTIFAVDISGEDDTSPVYYGESVSGFSILLNNLNPFRRQWIPSISDIQSRLAYVSSVQTLKTSKQLKGVVYMRIPPENLGVLEFGKFSETYKKGYVYAKKWISAWKKSNHGNLLENWTNPKTKRFTTPYTKSEDQWPGAQSRSKCRALQSVYFEGFTLAPNDYITSNDEDSDYSSGVDSSDVSEPLFMGSSHVDDDHMVSAKHSVYINSSKERKNPSYSLTSSRNIGAFESKSTIHTHEIGYSVIRENDSDNNSPLVSSSSTQSPVSYVERLYSASSGVSRIPNQVSKTMHISPVHSLNHCTPASFAGNKRFIHSKSLSDA
ncbi:Lysophospholipase NTE1 [Zancudomyces culisetae]|uniref:Lysophospholipase NTE1 n=1 Tax=Zancudomyces culisetae TaxID=1213189 RepID=A0A1R1PZJ4_ZANCU|nr:Lysophospholipase NTE1 [Zancudomyces culisetae]|eukprot:OMH86388.1 Lysophospholipase NTE1 [Zancudomyces culisetae]